MRKKHGTASDGISEEAAFEFGVLYSAVKDELVAFAAKEGNPYSFADVAARVAKLLQAEAVREQLRRPEYLSQMRQNGAGHHPGRPPKSGYYELGTTPEIFAGSSTGRPLKRMMSAAARKRISEAQRNRWAKFHREQRNTGWSPERRAKYSKMMKAKWADPKTGKKLRKEAASRKGRIVSPETRAKISAAQKASWEAKGGAA